MLPVVNLDIWSLGFYPDCETVEDLRLCRESRPVVGPRLRRDLSFLKCRGEDSRLRYTSAGRRTLMSCGTCSPARTPRLCRDTSITQQDMVPEEGLEPTHPKARAPKARVSTKFHHSGVMHCQAYLIINESARGGPPRHII